MREIIIITQLFLMAEELNMPFSSVFAREGISAMRTPVIMFNGPKTEMLNKQHQRK